MAEPTPEDQEQKLLQLSMAYDEALESRDANKIKQLVTDTVVLHKDDITLGDDVVGKAAVATYFKAYWEKYDYKHEAIAGAVDAQKMVVFSFSADRDVTPKKDAFPGLPQDAYKPRTTICIHKHEIDSSNKIKSIWFLRTLSSDELYRKMANPPNYDALRIDPDAYKGSHKGQSAAYRDAHYKVTKRFCQMYRTGDSSIADEVLEEDVRMVNPIVAMEVRGRQKMKEHLTDMFKNRWEPKSDKEDIAATAGDKAFVHWVSTGTDKALGKEVSMYGLDMLVISGQNRIREVLNFSQLLPSKRSELLKEE